jgi:transcriptional regulator with XRE-family HTH domain
MTTGSRIKLYRQQAGLTQEVLAGLAGVSPSWISQVERGIRAPDSLRCLIPVARVLGVQPMDLIEVPRRRERPETGTLNGLDELVAVLRRNPQRLTQTEPDLEGVAARLDAAEVLRREGRYIELAPMLATIIVDTESAARTAASTEHEATAFTWLSHAYQTAVYMMLSAGESHGVVWVAAERCSVAAQRTGDPVVEGLAARCHAYVCHHAGWMGESMETISSMLDTLSSVAANAPDPGRATGDPWWAPTPISLLGAFLLDGAKTAAVSNDRATAHQLLRRAAEAAAEVGEGSDLFSTVDVALASVAVAAELGDASEALRAGSELDTSSIRSFRDRPAWNHIRVARAYEAKRNPEAALHRLLEAERVAPELTRNHAMAREMVSAMLHRREGRSVTPGLRELADRVGVLN